MVSADDLKWIVPVTVVGGLLWRFARPSCEAFVFFLLEGNTSRHEKLVRGPLATEMEQLDDNTQRIDELERVTEAQQDSLRAFEAALVAQGATLQGHVSQVFTPLQRTLEKMESALERIADDTKQNAVQIAEIRGLWDGRERRRGGGRFDE